MSLLYPRRSDPETRTYWMEIDPDSQTAQLYPTSHRGDSPVTYRDITTLLRDEPPGRYICHGLSSSDWLEVGAENSARPMRLSVGRIGGSFKQIGRRYFVDAGVFGLRSRDDYLTLDDLFRRLGLIWQSSPGAVLLHEFLRDWYHSAFWRGPDVLNASISDSDVGSLTQCYRFGRRDSRVVMDENSAYASRALGAVPGAYVDSTNTRPRDRNLYYVTARVGTSQWAPAIGYRSKSGRCYFPSGEHVITIPEPELDYAASTGYSVTALQWHGYTSTNTLSDFVAWVYDNRRSAASSVGRDFFRRGLQAFLGKFSQRPGRRMLSWDTARWIGILEDREQPYYQPHVGAWIHGLQRAALHRASARCHEWPDIIDTDSMMLPSADECREPIGSDLGQWKVSRSGQAVILGARAYFCQSQCLAGYPHRIIDATDFVATCARLHESAVDPKHLALIETAPAIANGFGCSDRAITGTLYTRPWSVEEIEQGVPVSMMRESRKHRLDSLA